MSNLKDLFRRLPRVFAAALVAGSWSTGPAFAQGAMTNGENHPGTISVSGEVDQWTFSASQGDTAIVSIGEIVRVPDSGFYPWIRVYNPLGALVPLGSQFGALAAQVTFAATLTGTYTVLVSAGNAGSTNAVGDYVLRLARMPGAFAAPSGDHGGELTNGGNHPGRIEIADLDMWSFTANQGDSTIISIGEIPVGPGTPDPGFYPWIRVYDPVGALVPLGSQFGALAAQVAVAANLTGTYTVVVGAGNAGSLHAVGDYVLRLARMPGAFAVPSGDHGGELTNGGNHPGRIEIADLDMWSFTANQGDSLLVNIGEVPVPPGTPDPGFYPWIRVYDPLGAPVPLGSQFGALGARVSLAASLTGTYTVVVSAGNAGSIHTVGDYILRLARIPGTFIVPGGDHGGGMTNGVNHTGRIEIADLDMWSFTACIGSVLTLRIDEVPVGPGTPDPGFSPWIRLYGPLGALVPSGSQFGDTNAQITTTATLSGRFTVVVASADGGGSATGDYTVRIQGAQGTCGSAPTTVGDAYATTIGAPLTIPVPGVLANDNSNGGGAMTAELVSTAANGTVVLNANGSFTYTPPGGFTGTDNFSYRAVNAFGAGNAATVTVTVTQNTALPPIGLYASSIVGNIVTLRWTPPAAGLAPSNYVLEGGVNPGDVAGSIPINSTTPLFTFTAPTGAFYVRIHTLSGATRSAASNEIRIFVNVPAAPSAPANLVGLVNGGDLALAWRNTFEGGAPSSVILDVSGAINTSLSVGLTDTFQFAGVPGGTYTFWVRALNGAGVSSSSNPVTLTFPEGCSGAPLPPTGFLAYRVGNVITVLWDPATTGPAATDYTLTVTGAFAGSFTVPGRTLSGPVGPGSYTLAVAASNACGTSAATVTQTVVVR